MRCCSFWVISKTMSSFLKKNYFTYTVALQSVGTEIDHRTVSVGIHVVAMKNSIYKRLSKPFKNTGRNKHTRSSVLFFLRTPSQMFYGSEVFVIFSTCQAFLQTSGIYRTVTNWDALTICYQDNLVDWNTWIFLFFSKFDFNYFAGL